MSKKHLFGIRIITVLFFFLICFFLIVFITGYYSPKETRFRHTRSFNNFDPSQYFGKREYTCTGTCFCENVGRRVSKNAVKGGFSYLVFAISSLLAIRIAEGFLEEDCISNFSEEECPVGFVRSEIEECKEEEEGKIQNPVNYKYREFTEEFKEKKRRTVNMEPIGIVHSPWEDFSEIPVGRDEFEGTLGSIEIFEEYAEGIEKLDDFYYVYIFYIFDHVPEDVSSMRLVVDGKLESGEVRSAGVFGTRVPIRPNKMGMTIVRILEIEGNIIHIDGIDALDGSPVIDIKPFLHGYDVHVDAGCLREEDSDSSDEEG